MKPIPPVLKKILDEAVVSPPSGNLYGVRVGSKRSSSLPQIKAYDEEDTENELFPIFRLKPILPTDTPPPPSAPPPPPPPPDQGPRRQPPKPNSPKRPPLARQDVRSSGETKVPYQTGRGQSELSGYKLSREELKNIRGGDAARPDFTQPSFPGEKNPFARFAVGSAAAYYPFTKSYELSREYLTKGLPEPIAHYGSFAAAIPPAELAAQAATVGVPTAARALQAGLGLSRAAAIAGEATQAATAASLRSPATWLIGGYLATLPYMVDQEIELATKSAEQLKKYEQEKESEKRMLQQLGVYEEPGFWERMQDAFAKQSIIQSRQGPIGAAKGF